MVNINRNYKNLKSQIKTDIMRVLNLSLDASLFAKNSNTAQRLCNYGELSEKYFVVAPGRDAIIVDLSERVRAFASGGTNRAVQLFNMYRIAAKIIRQEKCDLITAQDPFEIGLIGLLLAKRCKIGLNVQEHGDFFSQPYWRRERILHFCRYYIGLYVIKKAESVRVVSRRIKKHLVEKLKINPDKIITVPVYTDLGALKKVARADRGNDFVFLNIGRFVKQKNLPLLLRAFARVRTEDPRAKLILAGRGPEADNLKKIRARLKLEDAVRIAGWLDDASEYYRQADAYVLSSNYEGWGRVIIEAAACGLPIVMTDTGCADEVLLNEKSALISPVNNAEKLAQNMLRLIKDNGLRKKIADSALSALENLPSKQENLELYKKSWEIAIK